jgi:hypothetical protein
VLLFDHPHADDPTCGRGVLVFVLAFKSVRCLHRCRIIMPVGIGMKLSGEFEFVSESVWRGEWFGKGDKRGMERCSMTFPGSKPSASATEVTVTTSNT